MDSKNRQTPSLANLKLALVTIWIFSAILRFWRLGAFNTLVFDEVYYAVFANNYLIGKEFFNAHPPFSQYMIAVGIWLGSLIPIGTEQVNGLAGSLLSTFSYRWMNAITGSLIPMLIGAIAWQLTHRRSYAVLAALFSALDGLFLVESRYALSNIYLVFLGLGGQLYLLLALADNSSGRRVKLTLAGIILGACVGVKWNGLGFLLGIYILWLLAWFLRCLNSWERRGKVVFPIHTKGFHHRARPPKSSRPCLSNFTQLNLVSMGWYFVLLPALTYSVVWIPHLLMNPTSGFWQIHQEIFQFHRQVGGDEIHPYCSPWYSWLIMGRPIAYFYHTALNTSETVPAYPPLPSGVGEIIYDVHAMGNPILWWLSTLAIILLTLVILLGLFKKGKQKFASNQSTWLMVYLVVNYAANLLPWSIVSRCTFIYHYMSASVFALMALAWIVGSWLTSRKIVYRQIGISLVILIVAAFCFWLPIYLGLPLSREGYKLRMWLPNWI